MTEPLSLPADGQFSFEQISLRGHRIRSAGLDGDFPVGDRPVAWLTDEPVANAGEVWLSLLFQCHATGLTPVIVLSDEEDGHPWNIDANTVRNLFFLSDPDEAVAALGSHSAESLLSQWWGDASDHGSFTAPFNGPFPGLAPATGGPPLSDAAIAAAQEVTNERIALVSARRPADGPTVFGWTGSINTDQEAWQLSTVLRSWEERFAAVLMAVRSDTMTVLVSHPPQTLEHALRVAAEHLAFCGDNIAQGSGDLQRYTREELFVPVAGERTTQPAQLWHFWWD